MTDNLDINFAALRPHTRRQAAATAASPRGAILRPIYVALAVVAATLAGALTVTGTDRVDSGWSVARPGSHSEGEEPADPRLRIAINQVLEQGHTPLLLAPAQTSTPAATIATPVANEPSLTREVEFDGWRSASSRGKASATIAAEKATSTEPAATTTDDASETATESVLPIESAETTPVVEEESTVETAPVESAPAEETPVDEAPQAEAAPIHTHAPPARTLTIEAATPLPHGDPSTVFEINDAENRPAEEPVQKEPASRESAITPVKKDPNSLTPLTKQMQSLRTRVRRVLKSYYNRPLNSRDNDPWEMMHGMLAYGIHSHVRQGSPQGKLITSVGWLCYNKPCKGMTLLYATKQGDLRAKYGVGLQGHMGQFLAMLAQCHVSPDYPIRVGKREYTVNDLIEAEKTTCYSKSELTFKLISLMHYCESDSQWVNDQGVEWDIPKLIHEELAQPIRGAACGGTHRLSGLSLAARTRVRRGEPLDGEYLRAAQFVEQYQKYAFQMQNRDGSLSTQWFRGRGSEPDTDRRVKTTGHILEWLCYSLNDEELQDARTVRAVSYLTNLLGTNYDHEWEVGPLSHALHALKLYNERVFQPYDSQQEIVSGPGKRSTAKRSSNGSRSRR